MFNPLWKFYRWFDALEGSGSWPESLRFMIFMGLIAMIIWAPFLSGFLFGLPDAYGHAFTLVSLFSLVFTRMWWLNVESKKSRND